MMEEGADWFEEGWWARRDSNPGPRDYESPALTAELRARPSATADQGFTLAGTVAR